MLDVSLCLCCSAVYVYFSFQLQWNMQYIDGITLNPQKLLIKSFYCRFVCKYILLLPLVWFYEFSMRMHMSTGKNNRLHGCWWLRKQNIFHKIILKNWDVMPESTPQFIIIAVDSREWYSLFFRGKREGERPTPQDENRPIMGFALIIQQHTKKLQCRKWKISRALGVKLINNCLTAMIDRSYKWAKFTPF